MQQLHDDDDTEVCAIWQYSRVCILPFLGAGCKSVRVQEASASESQEHESSVQQWEPEGTISPDLPGTSFCKHVASNSLCT